MHCLYTFLVKKVIRKFHEKQKEIKFTQNVSRKNAQKKSDQMLCILVPSETCTFFSTFKKFRFALVIFEIKKNENKINIKTRLGTNCFCLFQFVSIQFDTCLQIYFLLLQRKKLSVIVRTYSNFIGANRLSYGPGISAMHVLQRWKSIARKINYQKIARLGIWCHNDKIDSRQNLRFTKLSSRQIRLYKRCAQYRLYYRCNIGL